MPFRTQSGHINPLQGPFCLKGRHHCPPDHLTSRCPHGVSTLKAASLQTDGAPKPAREPSDSWLLIPQHPSAPPQAQVPPPPVGWHRATRLDPPAFPRARPPPTPVSAFPRPPCSPCPSPRKWLPILASWGGAPCYHHLVSLLGRTPPPKLQRGLHFSTKDMLPLSRGLLSLPLWRQGLPLS